MSLCTYSTTVPLNSAFHLPKQSQTNAVGYCDRVMKNGQVVQYNSTL